MHENGRIIERFYEAFQRGDAETMAAVYHPSARFDDPVFSLEGAAIGDMWRMFCEPGRTPRIEFSEVHADEKTGSARWEARYTFPPTGRQVHNVIEAEFTFDDGRVTHHSDRFDLPAWARQALGTSGALLGRSRFMQTRIRRQAAEQLARYRSRRAENG